MYDTSERSEYDFETGGAEGESSKRGGKSGGGGGGGGGRVGAPQQLALGPSQVDGGKCSDGMPALKGFVVANVSSVADKWYAAPTVPRDYNPFHTFAPDEGETGATAVTSGNWVVDEKGGWKLEKPEPKPQAAGGGGGGGGGRRPNMSAAQRGQALGEAKVTQLPPGVAPVNAAPPPAQRPVSLQAICRCL